jgi:hypothetical protein
MFLSLTLCFFLLLSVSFHAIRFLSMPFYVKFYVVLFPYTYVYLSIPIYVFCYVFLCRECLSMLFCIFLFY